MKNKREKDMKNRFADTGKSYAGYFLRFVFCLVLTASALSSQAQSRNQVSGKVTDTAGEPLIGATVVVVGTTTGTTTGIDGSYTINAAADSQLKFSFIGYAEQTVNVGARSVIDIVMEDDSQVLKDVVVIGYGTMEKKSVTSSITSIKGDDLTAGMGGSTIATALQGKVPGLTISGSASPNSSNDFQLRGIASVNASQSPLVVIDGIPGGDMRAINQEDIESIDVLKDASAGAIYGTRAAGGVILITTKRAKQGSVTANYTGEFSFETVRKYPELLSSSEYIEYGLGEDYGADTDWYKELTNDAPFSQRHTVSIAGGTEVAQVYTSRTRRVSSSATTARTIRDVSTPGSTSSTAWSRCAPTPSSARPSATTATRRASSRWPSASIPPFRFTTRPTLPSTTWSATASPARPSIPWPTSCCARRTAKTSGCWLTPL